MSEVRLKEPTLLQKRLWAEMQKPEVRSLREAANNAGFGEKTSLPAIMTALSQTTLVAELEKMEFTPGKVAKHLLDGLDAMKLHLESGGEEHWAPDWSVRHRYLSTLLRLFGIKTSGAPAEGSGDLVVQVTQFKQVFNLMEKSITAQREISTSRVVEVEDDDD